MLECTHNISTVNCHQQCEKKIHFIANSPGVVDLSVVVDSMVVVSSVTMGVKPFSSKLRFDDRQKNNNLYGSIS